LEAKSPDPDTAVDAGSDDFEASGFFGVVVQPRAAIEIPAAAYHARGSCLKAAMTILRDRKRLKAKR
jgi:hypothetical protein